MPRRSAPTSTSDPSLQRRRLAVLGAATVLVVAGHSYLVAPFFDFSRLGWAELLVRGGSIGVVAILAALGSATVAALHRTRRAQLRRLAALAVGLWVASAAAVAVVAASRALDPTDERAPLSGESLVRIATFSWNSYVANNPLAVAPELSGLWVLSVAMQLVGLVTLLTVVLAGRPWEIGALLAAGAVASTGWAWHLGESEGGFVTTLDTVAAGSAVLWGGCGTLLAGGLRAPRPRASLAVTGALGLLVCVVVVGELPVAAAWSGLNAVAALCVGLTVGAARPLGNGVARAAETSLGVIGRRWHLVVALSAPVLSLAGRHLPTADPATFALAWIALAAVAIGVPDVLGPITADAVDARRARRRRAAASAAGHHDELIQAGERTP